MHDARACRREPRTRCRWVLDLPRCRSGDEGGSDEACWRHATLWMCPSYDAGRFACAAGRPMTNEVPLLSAEQLAPVVRRALQAPNAWPSAWSCERIDIQAVNPGTAGLYRVVGDAGVAAGATRPWRMVLKVVHLPDLSGTPLESGFIKNPEDWNYWKREVLARRSGLPDRFTAPLRPVRCWGTEDVDDTTSWLWLEELDSSPRRPAWSLPGLAAAAYDLGAFSAQGLRMVEEVQDLPWALHGLLRPWFATSLAIGCQHALSHEGCWTHPLVRDRIPVSAHASFAQLAAAAEPLLDRLGGLPRTVAHHDAWGDNLFQEDGSQGRRTVAIDWDGFGTASIGEDLGHHIALNVFMGVISPDDAEEHERTATEAYLKGLRGFGWRGDDEEDVRFAAVTVGALQMLPFAVCHLAWLCPEFDEVEHWPQELAEKQSRDVDSVMDAWCRAFGYLLSLGERARNTVTD